MLAKLLKYELQRSYRTFLILALTIVLLLGLIGTPLMNVELLAYGFTWLIAITLVAVMAYVFSTIWNSYANLYNGKATLELMLPTTAGQKLSSKAIAGLIWCAVGTILFFVAIVGTLLIYMSRTSTPGEFAQIMQVITNPEKIRASLPWLGIAVGYLTLCCLLNIFIMFAAIGLSELVHKFQYIVSVVLVIVIWVVQGNVISTVANFVLNTNVTEFALMGDATGISFLFSAPGFTNTFSQVFSYALIQWGVMALSCVVWAIVAWWPLARRFNVR